MVKSNPSLHAYIFYESIYKLILNSELKAIFDEEMMYKELPNFNEKLSLKVTMKVLTYKKHVCKSPPNKSFFNQLKCLLRNLRPLLEN